MDERSESAIYNHKRIRNLMDQTRFCQLLRFIFILSLFQHQLDLLIDFPMLMNTEDHWMNKI